MCAVRSFTAPSVPNVFAQTWKIAQITSTTVNTLLSVPSNTRVRLSASLSSMSCWAFLSSTLSVSILLCSAIALPPGRFFLSVNRP